MLIAGRFLPSYTVFNVKTQNKVMYVGRLEEPYFETNFKLPQHSVTNK